MPSKMESHTMWFEKSGMAKDSAKLFPGISYIPDLIEVSEDKDLMTKIYLEFLDFLRCTTQILDLMHLLRNRHLRTTTPLSHAILREMLVLGDKGTLYKEFDRRVQEISVGISASLDSILRGGAGANRGKAMFTPILHKAEPAQQEKQLTRFQANLPPELHEITGKKSKPLWHSVALEKEDFLTSHQPEKNASLGSADDDIPPCKYAGRDIKRSNSQIVFFSTNFCRKNKIPASDPRFARQMDMMLASKAGFASVEAHQAYVLSKEAQWYKSFVSETVKLGLLGCDEVVAEFIKLGKHYDMSRDSLPFAKAKMCLIVMSLPFWDVGRVQFQRAVEFIMERILIIETEDERPLREWLKVRKIPYVITRPQVPTDYLTGQQQQQPGKEPSASGVDESPSTVVSQMNAAVTPRTSRI